MISPIDYGFLKEFLLTKKNIVITAHKTPDGDALGSCLALYHALKKNHNVNVIVPNEYPYYLKWMPGNSGVLIYEGNEPICGEIIQNADLLFFLDFNKLYRTYTMCDMLENSSACKIMIDHHEEPDDCCNYMLSDSSVASTAELIYDFLQHLDCELDQDISVCIYTGIITDTGSLRYPNVTQKTHQIVSDLMRFDISHSDIHERLYDSQNKSRLDLLKICLQNLKLYKNQHAALIFLMESDLMDSNYQKGDTEGFVNLPLSLKNITFSTFFIQFKDGIKISFRSQGDFDVNAFAKLYFNGGGHKNAAGGFIENRDMSLAIAYFEKTLKTHLVK